MPPRGVYRCAICRGAGHNARSCPVGPLRPVTHDTRVGRKRPDRGAVTVDPITLAKMRAYCAANDIGLAELVELACERSSATPAPRRNEP